MNGTPTSQTDHLLERALEVFDSAAIRELAQAGVRHDHLKGWLHDACDLVARRAMEEGRGAQAVGMFQALEELAPQQRRRWRSITRKLDEGSHLAQHLIELGQPDVDAWAQDRGILLNRRGLFTLIDRWIAAPAGVEIAAIQWNASDKIAGMARGALVGLAVLRGDAAGEVQQASQAMGTSKYAIGTGLVRCARRITDQQGSLDWARWPPQHATLAWIHQVCGSQVLLEAAKLLQVPPDIHQQTILPLLERVALAPLEAATAQVVVRSESGRCLRL